MLVQLDIIFATSSLVISVIFSVFSLSHLRFSSLTFAFCLSSLSLNIAASSKFCVLIASSFAFLVSNISSSKFFILSGNVYFLILIIEAASSMISIALSGKNLSFIYLDDNSTASSNASSVIVTL